MIHLFIKLKNLEMMNFTLFTILSILLEQHWFDATYWKYACLIGEYLNNLKSLEITGSNYVKDITDFALLDNFELVNLESLWIQWSTDNLNK